MFSPAFPDVIRTCLRTDGLLMEAKGETAAVSERAQILGARVQALLKEQGQMVAIQACMRAAQATLAPIDAPPAEETESVLGPLFMQWSLGAALFVAGFQLWSHIGPSLGPMPHLTGIARWAATGLASLFVGGGCVALAWGMRDTMARLLYGADPLGRRKT